MPVEHCDVRRSGVGKSVVICDRECYCVGSVVRVGVGCDLAGAVGSVAEIPFIAYNCAVRIVAAGCVEGYGFASVRIFGGVGEIGYGWNSPNV